jgi:cbb3-type cytochrome oxidase subunit 3
MIESIISLIENLQIELVIAVFAIYFILLLILIPVWVFIDSKKKFNNAYAPVLLFLLILPLNLPAFIFYIIIRPDEDMDGSFGNDEYHIANIPVVNFIGEKNDLVMGIDLRIHNSLLKAGVTPDFKLSVSSNEDTVEIIESESKVDDKDSKKEEEKEEKPKRESVLKRFRSKLKSLKSEYNDLTTEEENTAASESKDKKAEEVVAVEAQKEKAE